MNCATGNIEPLTKENFDKWRAQIQALLMKNNTWEYVSGEKIRTTENATEWDVADRKAISDITLAISPEALMQVNDCNTSKEVWDKLNEIYLLTDPTYKTMLMKWLIIYKMQEDGDMNSHIRNFSDLIDKLKEMDVNIPDEFKTILLLCSIPNSYEDFRIAIETQGKLPSFEAMKIELFKEAESKRRQNQEYENNISHNGSRIGHAMEVSTCSEPATKCTTQTATPSISKEVLYEEIIDILKDADYCTMTVKKVRLIIEAKFNIDLNDRKGEIDSLVMQYVNANSTEQEMEMDLVDEVAFDETEEETESELDDQEIEEE